LIQQQKEAKEKAEREAAEKVRLEKEAKEKAAREAEQKRLAEIAKKKEE